MRVVVVHFLIWGGGRGGGGVFFCISLSLRLPLSLRSRDATISLRLYGAEIIWNRDSCAQTFATCRYGCKVAARSNSTRPSAKEFSRTSEGFPSALRARRPPNLTQLRAEFLTSSGGVGRTDERTARMYEAGHDDMYDGGRASARFEMPHPGGRGPFLDRFWTGFGRPVTIFFL